MTILYRISALVRWLLRRDEIEQALDSDLQDYIERSVAEKMQLGMAEAEARRAARIELGGVEQTKDRVRAILSLGPVETFIADVGYAVRALTRQRTYTAVAALTLSLGIGVNVAIFSLADQLLLRPLPVPEPDRLVNLADPVTDVKFSGRMDALLFPLLAGSDSGGADTVFSYPMFRDLEREQEPFVGLAAHTFREASLSTGQRTRPATLAIVSGSYFPVLGLRPALGRLLGPEDDRIDRQADSVVLAHAYWRSEFNGDPDVVGQTLQVDDVPLTIVGVAPDGFHGTAVSARPSVFVPITISLSGNLPVFFAGGLVPNHDRRNFYWAHLFGRLKSDVSREQATASMNALYRAILSEVEAPLLVDVDEQEREAFRTRPLVLEPGARGQTHSQILDPARNGSKLLLAVSGIVLLLCCANVAGLMLLRATTRSGEIAVRASLGATRARLASLQLAESLVLSLPATLLSLPVAWLVLRGASRVPGIPEAAADMSLSIAATLVAIGVAVAATLFVGLLPIRDMIRTEPVKALRAYSARQTTGKGVARFRTVLATIQVALSMALLATTGIFVQSLANIARLDLGVDIDSVVMFSTTRPDGISFDADPTFVPRLTEALEAIPGVSSVASSNRPLLSLQEGVSEVTIEGVDADELRVSSNGVSPAFFQTFGIELLAGRPFNETDQQAVIVTQRFADHFGLAPELIVGRGIDVGARSLETGAVVMWEIVGVVADLTSGKVTDETEPQIFTRFPGRTFYVRGAQTQDALLNAVRETAARVDPTRPVLNLQTMEQQFHENVAMERFFTAASTAFAVLATALAALGLYGVLAYSVTQRSREFGLRFALGAPTGRVRRMVLRQVTGMVVIGGAIGAIAAAILSRAARNMIFGVETGDPLTLSVAAVVLTGVALGAAYIPARRASRVDPMSVLRYE
jgi:predicted permease